MHPYSKEMRKFCLADKTVNSFVIAVYMPMMCWRNGVLVNWKNDDLFSELESFENDFWNRLEEFSDSTDLLGAFDNWLGDADLYYERLRAELYMESRGFPHYYD